MGCKYVDESGALAEVSESRRPKHLHSASRGAPVDFDRRPDCGVSPTYERVWFLSVGYRGNSSRQFSGLAQSRQSPSQGSFIVSVTDPRQSLPRRSRFGRLETLRAAFRIHKSERKTSSAG